MICIGSKYSNNIINMVFEYYFNFAIIDYKNSFLYVYKEFSFFLSTHVTGLDIVNLIRYKFNLLDCKKKK